MKKICIFVFHKMSVNKTAIQISLFDGKSEISRSFLVQTAEESEKMANLNKMIFTENTRQLTQYKPAFSARSGLKQIGPARLGLKNIGPGRAARMPTPVSIYFLSFSQTVDTNLSVVFFTDLFSTKRVNSLEI